MSPTRKERLSLYLEDSMLKTETLSWKEETIKFTKDGKSSMLMSMKENQLKDNLTRSSDFMLKETSM
jgi:hypothetical protein